MNLSIHLVFSYSNYLSSVKYYAKLQIKIIDFKINWFNKWFRDTILHFHLKSPHLKLTHPPVYIREYEEVGS